MFKKKTIVTEESKGFDDSFEDSDDKSLKKMNTNPNIEFQKQNIEVKPMNKVLKPLKTKLVARKQPALF